MSGQLNRLDVDWGRFRTATGLVGQWQYQIDDSSLFSLYGQYAKLEYIGQNTRDADRGTAGVGYARSFPVRFSPTVFTGLYYADERERDRTRPDFGHKAWGVRLGGQLTLLDTVALFASAAYEDREYNGPDPFTGFGTRGDRQLDLRVGLNVTPAKFWTVSPQLALTDNQSNIPFNDFNRFQALISVRREFR